MPALRLRIYAHAKMNLAALLGFFTGTSVVVTILTLIVGVFIKRPLLPVAIGTGVAVALGIMGNDGLDSIQLLLTLMAGILLALWRETRHPPTEQEPSPVRSRRIEPEPEEATRIPPRRTEPVPYRVLEPLPYRMAASRGDSRPQRRVLHKLYVTAFWGLAVVCGCIALGYALTGLHDYLVVRKALSCVAETKSFPRCGLEQDSWGDTDVSGTWVGGRINEQDNRVWLMLASPLWFTPLALLVAARRWVLWLMRSDPGGSGSRG